MVSFPVDEAHINYSQEVTEARKNEIGKTVKKIELDDLKELRESIESLSWVESVRGNSKSAGSSNCGY